MKKLKFKIVTLVLIISMFSCTINKTDTDNVKYSEEYFVELVDFIIDKNDKFIKELDKTYPNVNLSKLENINYVDKENDVFVKYLVIFNKYNYIFYDMYVIIKSNINEKINLVHDSNTYEVKVKYITSNPLFYSDFIRGNVLDTGVSFYDGFVVFYFVIQENTIYFKGINWM